MMKKIIYFIAALSVVLNAAAYTAVNGTSASRVVGSDLVSDFIANNQDDQAQIPPPAGSTPLLLFSDLITGPDVGVGDSKGSGVIVTIWGQNLGSWQGESSIVFKDSLNVERTGHVYYWKNADGLLPGGPSNLYESHGIQEIAFSIPDSASGLGAIKVTVGGNSAEIPFTVRAGSIYHVKTNGNDSTGDGSFSNPWATVAKGDSVAMGGDTLYIHDVDTTTDVQSGSDSYAYYNNQRFLSDTTNQFAYVSYPNTRARLYGKVGVSMWETTGIVSSKLSVFASNCADETLNGCTENGTSGIAPSDWGRVIGNAITDRPGMCASGQAGAISGGINNIEGAKIYGNFVYEYGCANSDKLHHTTYFTIRDNANDATIAPVDVAWNYLKSNHAKNGLHFYDENAGSGSECGQFSGDILVHNNVVKDQGGNGISYESACGWSHDARIFNNVVINAGLPVDQDCTFNCGSTSNGIQILDGSDNGILGDVYVYNNTVFTWDAENQSQGLQSCISLRGFGDTAQVYLNDNVCYTALDRPFVRTFSFSGSVNHDDNLIGSKNVWNSSALNPTKAITPSFDASPIIASALLSLDGARVSVGAGSSVINQSTTDLAHDIYGVARGASSNVGAVQ